MIGVLPWQTLESKSEMSLQGAIQELCSYEEKGRELLLDQKQARKQRIGLSNEFSMEESTARALKCLINML